MAHLTCQDHQRRVHVTDTSVMHRADQSKCETLAVKIGKKHYGVSQVQFWIPDVALKTGELKNVDDNLNPEERLLKAIFAKEA